MCSFVQVAQRPSVTTAARDPYIMFPSGFFLFSANFFIGYHHYTVYALFYKDKELYRAV